MGSTLTNISALRQNHVGDGKNSGQTRALTPCEVVNVLAEEIMQKHTIAKEPRASPSPEEKSLKPAGRSPNPVGHHVDISPCLIIKL